MHEMSLTGEIHPAVCCLGYSRPGSMKRLLKSIAKAYIPYEDVTLIISIDRSEVSEEVEAVAGAFIWKHGQKRIISHAERLGVIRHTIKCGDLTDKYKALIYLEDDIVVSPGFYYYAVQAVNAYYGEKEIFGAALYSQKWLSSSDCFFEAAYNGSDVYLYNGDISWGQCWIDYQWKQFREWFDCNYGSLPEADCDLPKSVLNYGEQSWSRYVCFYMVKKHLYYTVPYQSYSTCMSESGVHTLASTDLLQVPLSEKKSGSFQFYKPDQCVAYDVFFERADRFVSEIKNIPVEEICIDLNGRKYEWPGYRYLLTVKKLPLPEIAGYGMNYEPVEMNIILDNRGDAIHLYRMEDSYVYKNNSIFFIYKKRVFHYLSRFQVKSLWYVSLKMLLIKIREKLYRVFWKK